MGDHNLVPHGRDDDLTTRMAAVLLRNTSADITADLRDHLTLLLPPPPGTEPLAPSSQTINQAQNQQPLAPSSSRLQRRPLTRHRTSNPCHHSPPGYREDRLTSSTRLKHRGLLFFHQNTCFTSPSQKAPMNKPGSPSRMTRKPETEEAMVSPLL